MTSASMMLLTRAAFAFPPLINAFTPTHLRVHPSALKVSLRFISTIHTSARASTGHPTAPANTSPVATPALHRGSSLPPLPLTEHSVKYLYLYFRLIKPG
ncbi:hypothetical protein EDB85DRAFT_2026959 [Lactarius pseudohatsudake]|nr:hypothetical protein EDB85DRAFT_2026959 [Lactarius pseudohatsudake]